MPGSLFTGTPSTHAGRNAAKHTPQALTNAPRYARLSMLVRRAAVAAARITRASPHRARHTHDAYARTHTYARAHTAAVLCQQQRQQYSSGGRSSSIQSEDIELPLNDASNNNSTMADAAAAAAEAAVDDAVKQVAAMDVSADKQPADSGAEPKPKPQQQQQQQQKGNNNKAKKAKKAKKAAPPMVDMEPDFVKARNAVWDRLKAAADAALAARDKAKITVTLPDGKVLDGVAFETSPMAIAEQISKNVSAFVVARVRPDGDAALAAAAAASGVSADDGTDEADASAASAAADEQLWDLGRPLEYSVHLSLLRFDDPAAKHVFWHSSSHILGQALERYFGAKLSIGPALDNGFYYDCSIDDGARSVLEDDWPSIKKLVSKITGAKQPFERLVVSKADALEMFKDNKYKQYIISTKVPDGAHCTAYRCGALIDLCRGPHIFHTGRVKAFEIEKNTGAYWLGKQENEVMQRVYGMAFPDKKLMKAHAAFKAEAARRNHLRIGQEQALFMRHEWSPGCAFFLPHGARIYNRLVELIKKEYWARGYEEVMSPNFFNTQLWKTSGHDAHYRDDMFFLSHKDDGDTEYALKPMNCPGHCLMFAQRVRSWRELPIRWADFGVLHRNEKSGALHGLTRVRRFQQDDSHIFCTAEQAPAEMLGCLEFMKKVYGIFGFEFTLELSTRPEKYMGDIAVWNTAEAQLEAMLSAFGAKWKLNPGDGAFYGPKIDVHIYDALHREHQCATIQLDFQLPINFDLKYVAKDGADDAVRPVIIHRAILGSVERMMGILIEHTAGKWPLWVSPRQALVVPVAPKYFEYAESVRQAVHDAGFYADAELSEKTMKKKIRDGQMAQYNYILVVGEQELEAGTVNVRTRDNVVHGAKDVAEFIKEIRQECDEYK